MYRFRSEDGVPGALVVWGTFIVLFAVMGVPAVLSIVLGALGGAAVGTILIYWRAEKRDSVAVETEESPIRPARPLFPVSVWRDRVAPLAIRPRSPQRLGKDTSSEESRSTGLRRSGSTFRDAVQKRKRSGLS